MSTKQPALLVSRVLALLMIIWALYEITYVPERLFALFHYREARSALATHDYLSSYYLIVTSFLLLRIVGYLVGAVFFWKCGPRVEALLSIQQHDEESPE